MDLTPEEKAAVRTLKRLEKRWPTSLWLFAGNGTLTVMRCDENGKRAMVSGGGYDADNAVSSINIACDGGDW